MKTLTSIIQFEFQNEEEEKEIERKRALVSVVPASMKPFFLTMKLDPIKMLNETANIRPLTSSIDIQLILPKSKRNPSNPIQSKTLESQVVSNP